MTNKTWLLSRDKRTSNLFTNNKLTKLQTVHLLAALPLSDAFSIFFFFILCCFCMTLLWYSVAKTWLISQSYQIMRWLPGTFYTAHALIISIYILIAYFVSYRAREEGESQFYHLQCYDTFGKYRALWTLPTNNVNIVRAHFKCERSRLKYLLILAPIILIELIAGIHVVTFSSLVARMTRWLHVYKWQRAIRHKNKRRTTWRIARYCLCLHTHVPSYYPLRCVHLEEILTNISDLNWNIFYKHIALIFLAQCNFRHAIFQIVASCHRLIFTFLQLWILSSILVIVYKIKSASCAI